MNDTNTTLEGCSARIIVELERHYSQNLPPPFTTLQFDNSNRSMCGSVIESVENYPGACRLPSSLAQDDDNNNTSPTITLGMFAGTTIPEWIENCIPFNHNYEHGEDPYANANMTGFMIYYDRCPAHLHWDKRSCHDWINETTMLPREIVRNVSLVDGVFTGMAVVSGNTWDDPWNETSVFVPDVGDSCWRVNCGWGRNVGTSRCIRFAQENLLKVSLAHYVDTIKHVYCE